MNSIGSLSVLVASVILVGAVPRARGPQSRSTPPPLLKRLRVERLRVEDGVLEGKTNWRVWGRQSLRVAPVYTVPLEDGITLVGFTSVRKGKPQARVLRISEDDRSLGELALGEGLELRGLAAESTEVFAALLWDAPGQRIHLRRFDADATPLTTTELRNVDNLPTDFDIGDSRLAYGDGRYGAYYHVSSDGHEGDTLKWVEATSGTESTAWPWGCSHSMSALLSFHPALGKFLSACVTDCYPGTDEGSFNESRGGIYLDRMWPVMELSAACDGRVAGELGGAACAPAGWRLVFNAHRAPVVYGSSGYRPASMNQDIGFCAITAELRPGPVVWLTDTPGLDESDASIVRLSPRELGELGDGDEAPRGEYLMGWRAGDVPWLARVDGEGQILEGPVDVGRRADWGHRDDPFRRHASGDVVWAWFNGPGSRKLHFARLRAAE